MKLKLLRLLLFFASPAFASPAAQLFAAEAAFTGKWETTYGRMVLQASGGDGSKLTGSYGHSGGAVNALAGTVAGRKFTFTYTEPGATGEGRFTLAEDGQSFDGQWKPQGSAEWASWSGRRAAGGKQDFSGVWNSSYGRMRLVQKSGKIEGCYHYSGRATLAGTEQDGVFSFTYREPDGTTGKGSLQLAADGTRFDGSWSADQGGGGGAWSGTRVAPEPGRTWLIILEARWEASLGEAEYSYGEMLRQFFTRVPAIAVRQRYFTGRADFAKWCAELTYLTEPAVLYVSSHGSEQGITVGGEVLDGKFIGEQLRFAPAVKLVHLGACLAMAGGVPAAIREASGLPAPISGYTLTADWAGSAVIDFAYLDLILARKMEPAQAAQQMQENVTFANEKAKPGSAIAPAGLKILP